ncbi:MAG: HEAT repeat domain-containing protein [Planctomycetes bacterium]|nr:HEAT repeat domain-containing protein [Planctomycetota bacterium]
MRLGIRAALAAAIFIGVLPPPAARAQEKPAAGEPAGDVKWVTEKEAFDLAKATGLPIMVCVNMDGEATNDRVPETLYRDPEFVRRSRSFICVMANRECHQEIDVNGVKVCSRFKTMPCSRHADHWRSLVIDRLQLVPANGNFISPQHHFYKADGSHICGKAYLESNDVLWPLMDQATEAAKPDVLQKLQPYLAIKSAAELRGKLTALVPIQRETLFQLLIDKGEGEQTKLVTTLAESTATPLDVRRDAVAALGLPGREEMLPALARAADDAKPEIRQAALRALARVGGKATWPILGDRLGKESVDAVRASLMALIADPMLEEPKVRAGLIVVFGREKNLGAKIALARRLAPWCESDAKVFDALNAERKKAAQPRLKAALWWAIGYGKPAEKPLAELSKEAAAEKQPRVREMALRAVGKMSGEPSEGYEEILTKAEEQEKEKEREAADPARRRPRPKEE